MNDIVKTVKTIATLIFSDGSEYTIPFVNNDSNSTDLQTYGTSCELQELLYTPSSSSVIGGVACNTLTIGLTSVDKLLVSSNKNSKYFGLMNATCKVKVDVTGDDGVTTDFGTYYIDAWENGASSDAWSSVTLTAGDLMSRIKNISIGKVRLKQHLTFSSYLISIIDTLNKKLSDDMKVNYVTEELQRLDSVYSTAWQMWYNNIERTDVETIFNIIAQNTLSYIWIDRTNTLRVDCLIDDKDETVVSNLDGSVNLFNYNVNNSDIYNYDGVSVKYINSVSYKDEQVLQLTDYSLNSGLNTVASNLTSDKVTNIHLIEVTTESGTATCVSFYYFRNDIEMSIMSDEDTVATITVYGTTIQESYADYDKYNTENTGTLLEVENLVMCGYSNITKFADNFANLISMENGQVDATGYINPQLELSNMINLKGTKLEIDDAYKIIGLDFTFGSSYSCKASLIKTVKPLDAA